MIEIYREPLFMQFPIISLLIGAVAFLIFALPLSFVALMDPAHLRAYRLQRSPEGQDRKWFFPSLQRLALNNICVLGFAVLLWPLMRLSGVHAGEPPPWIEVLWQLPIFLLVDDIGTYFVHRAMHTRWLYRRVHIVHHRITEPISLDGGYFHPVENELICIIALAGPIIVGAHIYTIYSWAVLRQWLAADGHSGYVFPWSPGRLLPGYLGPAFHDWHHRRCTGNFANCFGFLDRWFGTLLPEFAARRGVSRVLA
jgi:4-alpha-methyl-delta7-sterol-4alpha-methyl oxidase